MKKRVGLFFLVVSAILILLPLSCSMDLEPAKSGTTSVSFTIGTLIPPANTLAKLNPVPGRAVAPDYGYLYIRTIGGPTGDSGPFYGPFRLESGKTFTTTDIPAGTYQGIGILCATEQIESLTGYWNDQEMTFSELMSLPDDQFILFSDGPEESEEFSILEEMVDGFASGEMMKDVTIQANRTNTFALTLVPMCGPSSILMTEIPENNTYSEQGDPNQLIRKFIRLDNLQAPPGYIINTLLCTIQNQNTPYIGKAALFDDSGKLVKSFTLNKSITEDTTISASWTGDNTYYLYIEYQGELLSLAFDSTLVMSGPSGSIQLTVDAGATNGGNKKLLAGIYPYTGPEHPETPPVAIAVIDLDLQGTGTATFLTTGTNQSHSFPSGTWLLTAFVDYNENYTDINQPLNTVVGIEPHHGDYTFEATITTDGTSMNFGINQSNFDMSETYVYYLSQSTTGTGDGWRMENAMSMSEFVDLLNNVATNSQTINAYLVQDIELYSYTISVNNNCNVTLMSTSPATSYRVSLDNYSYFVVNAGTELRFKNIVIDGNSASGGYPFVDVSGRFTLDKNAVLRNRTRSTNHGGAIYIDEGGEAIMNAGALINNCKSPNYRGGAVYVAGITNTSTFTMNGGTISNCTATYAGAISGNGQYAAIIITGGIVEFCVAEINPGQYGNGGAIYISSNAHLTLQGTALIRECTASLGWAISGMGIPSTMVNPAYDGPEIQSHIENFDSTAIQFES